MSVQVNANGHALLWRILREMYTSFCTSSRGKRTRAFLQRDVFTNPSLTKFFCGSETFHSCLEEVCSA